MFKLIWCSLFHKKYHKLVDRHRLESGTWYYKHTCEKCGESFGFFDWESKRKGWT